LKIETIWIFSLIVFTSLKVSGNSARRLGKLDTQNWLTHSYLGQNQSPYQKSETIPDFSPIGALLSDGGILGTATLISPDTIITAAHVIKNKTLDPLPTPSDWEFILYHDFSSAPSSLRFGIESFTIHPDWISRQEINPPWGDGDTYGVDVAIARLSNPVIGYQPLCLPDSESLNEGQKVFIAGYGTLVEGKTGKQNDKNSKRMVGENILDRVVKEVKFDSELVSGGLLAFDFDSPNSNSNRLGLENATLGPLPAGSSDSIPLTFEVSTAEGDSGGPLIAFKNQKWRIFGTVSYGSSDSTYGDVTVLTRLQNHLDWIYQNISIWPTAKLLSTSGWKESDWFGVFIPYSSGWSYHVRLGWFWSITKTADSVWFYVEHLGWLWTSLSAFPYLFSSGENDWLYLDINNTDNSKWRTYHFFLSNWQLNTIQ
jgi:V8-like Glu-specific endopeptidase